MAAIAASLAESSLRDESGEASNNNKAVRKGVDQLLGPTAEKPLTSKQPSAASPQRTELKNGISSKHT